MSLTPGERDHLLLFTQALLAAQRRERGLRLNVPEATALIANAVCEWARDGLDLASARHRARQLLGPADVLDEVPDILTEIRVEARFDDGTRLVVVDDPFNRGATPSASLTPPSATAHLAIENTADIAIGITSHLHLAEANPRLRFDRSAAFGMRLALPTGDTLWLESGTTATVGLCPIGGGRVVIGNSGLIDGPLDDTGVRSRALDRLRACGYLDVVDGAAVNSPADAEQAASRALRERRRS